MLACLPDCYLLVVLPLARVILSSVPNQVSPTGSEAADYLWPPDPIRTTVMKQWQVSGMGAALGKDASDFHCSYRKFSKFS